MCAVYELIIIRLDPVYPIVFFDALRVKIRDEGFVKDRQSSPAQAVVLHDQECDVASDQIAIKSCLGGFHGDALLQVDAVANAAALGRREIATEACRESLTRSARIHKPLISRSMSNNMSMRLTEDWRRILISRFVGLAKLLAISPAKGAETIVYLASSPEIAATTGQYFYKCRPIAPSREAKNARTAHLLWERSAALAGLGGSSLVQGISRRV
jgi:hypothetical protein